MGREITGLDHPTPLISSNVIGVMLIPRESTLRTPAICSSLAQYLSRFKIPPSNVFWELVLKSFVKIWQESSFSIIMNFVWVVLTICMCVEVYVLAISHALAYHWSNVTQSKWLNLDFVYQITPTYIFTVITIWLCCKYSSRIWISESRSYAL